MEPRISSMMPMGARAVQQQQASQYVAIQVESEQDLVQFFTMTLFNPMQQAQRFRNIKDLHSKESQRSEEAEASEETEEKILSVEKIDTASERFQKNNQELNAKTLKILREQLDASDTPDEILEKVTNIYKDPALADEALDFLMETTEGQLLLATSEAKEKFRKDNGREIAAGRNMGAQAREFSEKGLGSPTSLRELYRDITLNQREPLKLFEELTTRFPYALLRPAIHFLLHSIGSDLRAKGPSIPRAELQKLLQETRSIQGILTTFRFFQSRMRLIQRELSSRQILMPQRLDFELIAKTFIKLISERFLSSDKIQSSAPILGIPKETAAQIVVFAQMRDAVRQMPPKYFRDQKHKEELLQAFLDLLKKLDDKLEEEEDEK